MLVTFSTKSYGNITMFGEIAVELIKLMGYSGQVPGAISADDVPEALQNLKKKLGKVKDVNETETEDHEPSITLSQRAWPLIQLLEHASQSHSSVMWK